MALVLPATLSPSKVSTFSDCALAFRYSAVDQLPEPPNLAASRGRSSGGLLAPAVGHAKLAVFAVHPVVVVVPFVVAGSDAVFYQQLYQGFSN